MEYRNPNLKDYPNCTWNMVLMHLKVSSKIFKIWLKLLNHLHFKVILYLALIPSKAFTSMFTPFSSGLHLGSKQNQLKKAA